MLKREVNATLISVGSDDVSASPRATFEFTKEGRLDLPISPEEAKELGKLLYTRIALVISVGVPK